MRTIDEEIAYQLRAAAASGELSQAKGYGKPFPEDDGWNDTLEALRMPFRILRNAGIVPPEIEMFRERAALSAAISSCTDDAERRKLRQRLSEIEQALANTAGDDARHWRGVAVTGGRH